MSPVQHSPAGKGTNKTNDVEMTSPTGQASNTQSPGHDKFKQPRSRRNSARGTNKAAVPTTPPVTSKVSTPDRDTSTPNSKRQRSQSESSSKGEPSKHKASQDFPKTPETLKALDLPDLSSMFSGSPSESEGDEGTDVIDPTSLTHLDMKDSLQEIASAMNKLASISISAKRITKAIHQSVSKLDSRLTKVESEARTSKALASAYNKKVDQVKKDLQDHDERLDLHDARLTKLEDSAASNNRWILDKIKSDRIADHQAHDAHFIFASPELDIHASPDDWTKHFIEIVISTDHTITHQQVFNMIVCVNVLDRKLLRTARQNGPSYRLNYPLQIVVQMGTREAKIDLTDRLSKLFRRKPAQYKGFRVSRFIPPSLRPEQATIRRIMKDVIKDNRNARYNVIPVYDPEVGFTLKVLYTPDINTQPQLKEYPVTYDKPYPVPTWRPATS